MEACYDTAYDYRTEDDGDNEGDVTIYRSPEQIHRDLDARIVEMEHQRLSIAAEALRLKYYCSACKWSSNNRFCVQPLITGFENHSVWVEDSPYMNRGIAADRIKLCGVEKALWVNRQNWFQRLIAFILQLVAR